MKALFSLPSWLIILICTCVGLIVAIAGFEEPFSDGDPLLTGLPALPAPAAAINQIDSWGYLRANPYIQTTDGQVYRLTGNEGAYFWEIGVPPVRLETGEECSRSQIRLIEAASSSVAACRSVRTRDEWCPGPVVAFAISEKGGVWKLSKRDPCWFLYLLRIEIFGPVGFGVGLVIVFVRFIIRWAFKMEMVFGGWADESMV